LGAEGLPFMNRTTLCLFMSCLHRATISSSVLCFGSAGAGAAGVAVEVDCGVDDEPVEPEC
jgi:hypothetical protein